MPRAGKRSAEQISPALRRAAGIDARAVFLPMESILLSAGRRLPIRESAPVSQILTLAGRRQTDPSLLRTHGRAVARLRYLCPNPGAWLPIKQLGRRRTDRAPLQRSRGSTRQCSGKRSAEEPRRILGVARSHL